MPTMVERIRAMMHHPARAGIAAGEPLRDAARRRAAHVVVGRAMGLGVDEFDLGAMWAPSDDWGRLCALCAPEALEPALELDEATAEQARLTGHALSRHTGEDEVLVHARAVSHARSLLRSRTHQFIASADTVTRAVR